MMITRTPILTSLPVEGQYRYQDLLQIIPPKREDPCPPRGMGRYGATLAVAFDERVAPERPTDIWAHDHSERARFSLLEAEVQGGSGDLAWLNHARRIQSMYRRLAVEHEALRLLVVLTNNTFRERPTGGHEWYFSPDTSTPVNAQPGYPSFVTDGYGSFWDGEVEQIGRVATQEHFARAGMPITPTALSLPADLDDRLDDYFALPPTRKTACARAFELFWNGQAIWPTSRSLSLTAYVFAIDALCHAEDPKPLRCPGCQNLISDEVCTKCGGPRFGLTRRFRAFVERFIADEEEQHFAGELFRVRSDIAHRGELLRADEFDAGFHVGGADDQGDLERGVGQTVRKVLIGWLSSTAAGSIPNRTG